MTPSPKRNPLKAVKSLRSEPLSEKIETAIIQHSKSFNRGLGHNDLSRFGKRWELKVCKNSGLTINQSSIIKGENYIVVNYEKNSQVKKVWVLWNSKDEFFSDRKRNTNARYLVMAVAKDNVDVIYDKKDKAF